MATIDIGEAILSEALIGKEGEKTGESVGDGRYEIVRTRFEFWNILDDEDSASSSSSLSEDEGRSGTISEAKIDSEGDFKLIRRPKCRDYLEIDHTMATRLADVGLQIWNGALVLCDYLLFRPCEVSQKRVLELGCGVGLSSICAAMAGAEVVYATDADEEALQLLRRNALLNRYLIPNGQGNGQNVIKARILNWRSPISTTEPENDDLRGCSTIIAADVIYDPNLNEALFTLVEKLCENRQNDVVVLISLEKRYNFVLSQMMVACPAYESFISWMERLQEKGWTSEKIDTAGVPVCFTYRRSGDMELWRLIRPGVSGLENAR